MSSVQSTASWFSIQRAAVDRRPRHCAGNEQRAKGLPLVDRPFRPDVVGLVLACQHDMELAGQFTAAIETLKTDGTLQAVSLKWFGTDLVSD